MFGYQEIARKELGWKSIWLARNCKKKKTKKKKEGNSDWIKKIVRILKEEIKKRKNKLEQIRNIFLEADVFFYYYFFM